MIGDATEFEKLELSQLSVETRKQLLEAIRRDVIEKYPEDPEAQRAAMIAIERLKMTLD